MKRSPGSTPLLLVFQHKELRSFIGEELASEGWRTRGVDTLEEALALIRSGRIQPALLILDSQNQPMTLGAMSSIPSELSVLVLTGPFDRCGPLLSQRPRTVMMEKPFILSDLVDAVHKIML